MIVQYDPQIKVAGIGLVPWTRLGPEKWFTDYKIASLFGWDMEGVESPLEVMALSDNPETMPSLARLNSQQLLNSTAFQELLLQRFKGFNFLTYKSVVPPEVLLDAGCRFLTTNQNLAAKLENKANFRRLFSAQKLPFPTFSIQKRSSLQANTSSLSMLLNRRESVVIQDEKLSGGRGTFIVQTVDDLAQALVSTQELNGGDYFVVSDFIDNAHERSVQCCVTRYGIFVGPLQKQIVRHPLLANINVPYGDRFCGAEISSRDRFGAAYAEIRTKAIIIGEQLQQMGYRGVFGVDCLVTEQGKVYVLEINPRLTGLTPLLTMLYREGLDIPFYLLHVLELGNFDYKITNYETDLASSEGSLLILHSQQKVPTNISNAPSSGIYDFEPFSLNRKYYQLSNDILDSQVLIQRYIPPNFRIKPGGRLVSIYTRGSVLDVNDNLLPEVVNKITNVSENIILQLESRVK